MKEYRVNYKVPQGSYYAETQDIVLKANTSRIEDGLLMFLDEEDEVLAAYDKKLIVSYHQTEYTKTLDKINKRISKINNR